MIWNYPFELTTADGVVIAIDSAIEATSTATLAEVVEKAVPRLYAPEGVQEPLRG